MTFADTWETAGGGADRTEYYRTWRTKLGIGAVTDLDQIEYRYRGGEPVPVAVIELGTADWGPAGGFLDPECPGSFPARVAPTRGQGVVLRLVAKALGVPFYGVVTLTDQVEVFHVWNFSAGRYRVMTQVEYVAWLRQL